MLGVMMAGGGGTRRRVERRADDYYRTPPEAVWPLIQAELRHLRARGIDTILEPAVGDGRIARELVDQGYTVRAADIADRGWPGTVVQDYLTAAPVPGAAIVTNPPFELATAFIERAFTTGVPCLALLLKSTFWHADGRRALFDRWRPHVIHALTFRLDFEDAGAPTMECSWFVWWHPGYALAPPHPGDPAYRLMPRVADPRQGALL